jgi:hypothetical protein
MSTDLAALEREITRSMAEDVVYFTQHYLRDDDGNPFDLEPFHVEMLELSSSTAKEDEKVILLEPAAHGKTTLAIICASVFDVCMDPDDIIAIGCKNYPDGKDRLRAIKAILEKNEALIEDFGPFVGPVWTEDQIVVARRRNWSVKEPTIRVFGSETSVFGWRAKKVRLDDYITLQNSGPQVEENTRNRVRTNFNDGVLKMGYPKKPFKVVWVNTVVDLRDLIHEKAALNGQMPDDARVHWRSDKGFRVVRREALDESTGAVLWPSAHTKESLEEEKATDLMTFLRRMQNRCIDPQTVAFQRRWFDGDDSLVPPAPGCLDRERVLGAPFVGKQWPSWTLSGGYDPNPGTSENSKYCAYVELAFDRTVDEPRAYYINDIARFRGTLPQQEEFVVRRAIERTIALILIEANVQNQWLLQLPGMQAAVKSGRRIEPHWTSVKNKPDPETGIPSLAGMVRAGLIRFPYGDARSRQLSETLIAEMLAYPQGATSDILMALWFAILAAKKVSKRMGLRVFGGGTIPFISNRTVSPERVDRYFGAKVWPYPTVTDRANPEPMIAGEVARRGTRDGD